MKKITFLLVLISAMTFAQNTVTWDNYDANAIFTPEQIVPVEITWSSADVDYICMWVRQYDDMGAMVEDYAAFGVCPLPGDGPLDPPNPNSGTQIIDFPIPADTPDSSSLPEGHRLDLVIFMSSEAGDPAFANGDQSITVSSTNIVRWDNYDENAIYAPEQIVPVDISWSSADVDYICMWVRQYDDMGAMVEDYAAFGVCPLPGDGPLDPPNPNSGTQTIDFPIPADTPDSSSLPTGHRLDLVIFMSSEAGDPAFANGDQSITVSSTASAEDFNKAKLAAYYNASKDAIVIDSKEAGAFSVYDLTGRRVLKGEVSNEINMSALKTGLYILTTKNGFLKFVK